MRLSHLAFLHVAQLAWFGFIAVFRAFQEFVVWQWTGTAARKRQIAARLLLEDSASSSSASSSSASDDDWMKKPTSQVMRIIGRFKLDSYIAPARLADFLAVHDGFETPEYLLRNYVTLYYVNDEEAVFVENRPGLDVWRGEVSAFLINAQYTHAVRLHRLPLVAFHRLADRLGDPKGRVIFLTNTARCGSTLLTQMFEMTEKVVAFGEPYSLNMLTLAAEKRRTASVDRQIVSAVRVLCKPTSINEIAYVLKLTAPALQGLHVLAELFPDAIKLFMYRDSLKVAQSLYRLGEEFASVKTLYTVGKGSSMRLQWCVEAMGFPREDYKFVIHHDLSIGAMLWASSMKQYAAFRKSGMDLVGVRYEDIIKDPVESMRRILAYCRLPEELAASAKRALGLDSQRNTPISTERLNKHRVLEYSGAAKDECDYIMDALGTPARLGQPYIAPGTITADHQPTNK